NYGADYHLYPAAPWQWLIRAVAASPDDASPAGAWCLLLYGSDPISRAYLDCGGQYCGWPGTGWGAPCPPDPAGCPARHPPRLARHCGVGPRGADLTTRLLRPGGGGVSQPAGHDRG